MRTVSLEERQHRGFCAGLSAGFNGEGCMRGRSPFLRERDEALSGDRAHHAKSAARLSAPFLPCFDTMPEGHRLLPAQPRHRPRSVRQTPKTVRHLLHNVWRMSLPSKQVATRPEHEPVQRQPLPRQSHHLP
jgi:hypothetical protein